MFDCISPSVHNMSFFSPMVDFKSFFFDTGFEQYGYNVPWSVFFVCLFFLCLSHWGLLSFLDLYIYSFHQLGNILAIIFLNILPIVPCPSQIETPIIIY